jgi:hypothetical protein
MLEVFNMRFYEPKHFKPQEFLPPTIYSLMVMDPRILWTLDSLRDYFKKPISINNWFEKGPFSQRGFRNDPNTGAPLSQHRFGRACDFDIKGTSAEEFRSLAKSGALNHELTYITRIEENTTWCHIDCAAIPGTEILFFKP